MLLDFLSRVKRGGKKVYYLGLIVKEDEGCAFILESDNAFKKTKKIDQKKFSYSDSWERIVEDVDEVLFQLEKNNKIKVNQAIFFLYSHLVDQKNKQIKKPYLLKIKKIASELELKPLGYIEFHEALSLRLEEKEEAPLTSIIIELDKQSISLLVYKGGELVFSDTIAKTEDLLSDLESIFAKIKGEIILPSRIIIYDSDRLEKESTDIIAHKWDENLFIQIPRVEVLTEDKLVEALIYSFNRQIFGEEEGRVIEKKHDEVLGFLIGKDIKREKEAEAEPEKIEKREEEAKKEKETQEPVGVEQKKAPFLATIRSTLSNFFANFTFEFNFVLLAIIGLSLILSSLFAAVYFLHQTTLILYFEGKKIEKELNIKGVLEGAGGGDKLKLDKAEQTVEAQETIETTGEKIIGEKAKGEVVIHNWQPQEKVFKQGTILTTDSGIKFALDDDVKVASASEISVGVKETGKTKVKMTASDIGSEGNIGKDVKMTVEDFAQSLHFAVANSSFSGGSQQSVRTASKDDMEGLKNKVESKIKKEGDKLLEQAGKKGTILQNLTEVTIEKEEYSKELGEEAEELSLKAKGNVAFYTYREEELKKIILDSLAELVPENYKLQDKNLTYTFSKPEHEKEEIAMTVNVKGKAIVKVDTDNLKKKVQGKKINELDKVVKKEHNPQRLEVKMKSDLPILKEWMPFFEKNIQIKVESL